jgi:hypothetical protein
MPIQTQCVGRNSRCAQSSGRNGSMQEIASVH